MRHHQLLLAFGASCRDLQRRRRPLTSCLRGYDVATQAEDMLGLLDALAIERAVFAGRTIATQELTWIAEHHPERVTGLVYPGTPHVSGTGQG